MRLTMSERRLLVKLEAKRYRTARKKEKGRILDELVALSGYCVGMASSSRSVAG